MKVKHKSIHDEIHEWMDENVAMFTDELGKYYSTQDSMYRNKIRSKKDLIKYCLKEFC